MSFFFFVIYTFSFSSSPTIFRTRFCFSSIAQYSFDKSKNTETNFSNQLKYTFIRHNGRRRKTKVLNITSHSFMKHVRRSVTLYCELSRRTWAWLTAKSLEPSSLRSRQRRDVKSRVKSPSHTCVGVKSVCPKSFVRIGVATDDRRYYTPLRRR